MEDNVELILKKGSIVQAKFEGVIHVSGDVYFEVTGKLKNVVTSIDKNFVQIDTGNKIKEKANKIVSDRLDKQGVNCLFSFNYRDTIDGVDFNIQILEVLATRKVNNKESL